MLVSARTCDPCQQHETMRLDTRETRKGYMEDGKGCLVYKSTFIKLVSVRFIVLIAFMFVSALTRLQVLRFF